MSNVKQSINLLIYIKTESKSSNFKIKNYLISQKIDILARFGINKNQMEYWHKNASARALKSYRNVAKNVEMKKLNEISRTLMEIRKSLPIFFLFW